MIRRIRESRYVNQRNFVLAVSGAALAAITGFFIYEFRFLRPPKLDLAAPARNMLVAGDAFDIRGLTDPDADLTVNGRPLYSGETGEFTERMFLSKGLNRIELEAKNRYGKTSRIIRYLVVP